MGAGISVGPGAASDLSVVRPVTELRPRARTENEFTSALGMIVFLGSWAMMFCALFFSYGFLRANSPAWPPAGVPVLPVALPAVNTLVLLASSATFARGLGALRRGQRPALTRWVGATLLLGAAFLALQIVVWRSVSQSGLHLTSGMYGSVFYGLTLIHALHVAAGLLLLLWVAVRSAGGAYSEHNYVNVRLCGMFWHFIDVVWVLMFVSVYLL